MVNKKNWTLVIVFLMGFLFLKFNSVHAEDIAFNSPIPATTVPELANIIVRAVLAGASVVAFLSFIWAGWLWFYSRGDATLITKSKNIMIWAIFGLVAILLSFAAVNTILGAVGA